MHTRTRGIPKAFRATLYALLALSTTAARPIEIAPEERPYPAPIITEQGISGAPYGESLRAAVEATEAERAARATGG